MFGSRSVLIAAVAAGAFPAAAGEIVLTNGRIEVSLDDATGAIRLMSDLEFMQVAIPWLQLADQGVEVEAVPHRDGAVLAEDFAERMTPRTRVVVLGAVQWSTGYRCDLDALSRLCRERGAWLVVDAIQQLGACPIDVRATPVDLLACGGHKWLNAPFGCGFRYLRRDRWDDLRPPMAGYLSVEPPEGGWGTYFQTPSITPVREYRFTRDAQRYEIGGTANYPGAIGLAADLPTVLLRRRPEGVDRAVRRNDDLQLSGHTHAGQLPPADLLIWLTHRHPFGYYEEGRLRVYVSSGTGTWGPPMRLFSRNEIVRFTLVGE